MTPAEFAIVFGAIATPTAAGFGAFLAWRGSRKTTLTNAEVAKEANAVSAREANSREFTVLIGGFKDALATVQDQFDSLEKKYTALESKYDALAEKHDALSEETRLKHRQQEEMIEHIHALEALVPNPPGPPRRPDWL